MNSNSSKVAMRGLSFHSSLHGGSRCCSAAQRGACVRRRPSLPSKPTTSTTTTTTLTASGSNGNSHFFSTTTRWCKEKKPGDQPFHSVLDLDPVMVRVSRRRHGPGLIILAAIPITAFILGTWQVQRLGWKSDLLARLEDRIVRDPLPLPPRIDPSIIADEFDHRRVYATGRLRHDQEMLVGPRIRDGENGYQVYTPLERCVDGGHGGGGGDGSGATSAANSTTVLVNRGWISKKFKDQRSRPDGLPKGTVTIEGLLRAPWKKNWFTPDNRPERGDFFFPDIEQMAELTGAQPVWIEATMEHEFLKMADYQARGIPYGRPAAVNINNNHSQYIFTWYALSAATSVMFYLVVKKPPNTARLVSTRIM